MAAYNLDFEKPLIEIQKKIEEIENIHGTTEEVIKLKKEAEKLRKKIYSGLNRWQRVLVARHPNRPYTLDYINLFVKDFIELHGDRLFRDDPAIVAGIGKIEEQTVMIIGHQKGRDTKEKLKRNFGMPHPEGYRKAMRLMRLAEKYGIPVVTFVDTPGAYPGIGAEERGQSNAIAESLMLMGLLGVPIVVIITGEGGSGGALAIAVGDRVFMLENSVYSVISPEGCASILWRDSTKASEAAEALKLTAEDLLGLGIIDGIIPESSGAAHNDWEGTALIMKKHIVEALSELAQYSVEELISKRVEKYRKIGFYKEEK